MRSHERKGILAVLIPLSFLVCPVVAGESVTPTPSGARIDYVAKLNELVQKGSDESRNAEPSYREACTRCVRSVPYVDMWSWPTSWSSEQHASVKDWVKANTHALALLRYGTRQPSYWFEYKGRSVWEMDRASYWASVRLLVFALTLRTKLEAAEGKMENAAEHVLAGCRFGLDVRKRLFLMEQLIGIAASNYPLDTGFQILGRCAVDPSLLKRLQDRLMELSRDPMWLVDLRGEEIATLDAVQEVYAHSRGGRDKEAMGVIDKIRASGLLVKPKEDLEIELTAEQVYSSVDGHTPEEMAGLVKKGYAHFGALVSKTPFQWKKEAVDADQRWKELVDGNTLLIILAPAISRVSEGSFRTRASRDALIATSALLRHKHDKGVFPADLQILVSAGYMTEAPMDPYSDRPLVYKRIGSDFILYSVGADFRDDGGKHDRRWGEGKQGGDYVFWPIRTE